MMQYPGKSDLKRFFKKCILLVIVLIILDSIIGGIFKYYYFKQKSGLLYRTTYSIDSTKADLLVFGSSRANHHYVPSVFEKKLNTTFYNCGRDGCFLIYSAAVISAVVDRYSPKCVIIDLTPNELCQSEEGQLAPLFPYYQNPAIRPYISYNSKFENYKLLSKMYIYNSLLTNVVAGNLSFNRSRSSDDKGYVGLNNVMNYAKREVHHEAPVIASRTKILNDLLTKLNKKHIAVTVVISPSYFSFQPGNPMVSEIEKMCSGFNNTKFINYENNHDYDGYQLYSDTYHLNQTGAYKFSADLSSKIFQ